MEANLADGALGYIEVTSGSQVELDHSIGFSGSELKSVHLHPAVREHILVAVLF